MVRNGDIERIYRKYGIWDAQQAELVDIVEKGRFYGYLKAAAARVEQGAMPAQEAVRAEVRKRGWQIVGDYSGILAKSAAMTVVLSALSFPLAILRPQLTPPPSGE
jgi:hypothetical protein